MPAASTLERRLTFTSFMAAALKQHRSAFLMASCLFALLLSFMIGVIFFFALPLPPDMSVPARYLITRGPALLVPWLVIYLNRYMAFSINPEAALYLSLPSLLFGANVTAYRFARRSSSCNCAPSAPYSALGALISFFAIFSCCGDGIALLLLSSAGLGALVFNLYGLRYAIPAFAGLILLLSLYLAYSSWRAAGGGGAAKA